MAVVSLACHFLLCPWSMLGYCTPALFILITYTHRANGFSVFSSISQSPKNVFFPKCQAEIHIRRRYFEATVRIQHHDNCLDEVVSPLHNIPPMQCRDRTPTVSQALLHHISAELHQSFFRQNGKKSFKCLWSIFTTLCSLFIHIYTNVGRSRGPIALSSKSR